MWPIFVLMLSWVLRLWYVAFYVGVFLVCTRCCVVWSEWFLLLTIVTVTPVHQGTEVCELSHAL
jgi:predicted tellurium resistance membrane protein TerC